jgi:hypothetical protein
MDLSKILSISGKRGLFKVVSQLKNAVLVESLLDKKRFPAFPHEKISSLEEIAVFTTGEDLQLKDILKLMFEKQEGKAALDSRSPDDQLKSFFIGIVPDYDQERVYISDIKKIIGWYNLLLEHELLDFTEKKEEEAGDAQGSAKEVTGETEKLAPARKRKTPVKETGAGQKTGKKKISGTAAKSRKKEG